MGIISERLAERFSLAEWLVEEEERKQAWDWVSGLRLAGTIICFLEDVMYVL